MKKNLIPIGLVMMLTTFASCGGNSGANQVDPAVVHDTIVAHDSVASATQPEKPVSVADDKDAPEEESATETVDDDALVKEHIAYLEDFYRAFFITNTGWRHENKYLAHMSPAIKKEMRDRYEYCGDTDSYAWWIFRDNSTDFSDKIYIKVTHDSGDWYNVHYKDADDINVKVRVEGSGRNLMITGLRSPIGRTDIE